MAKDYTKEIRRYETLYERIDIEVAKRKQKIAAKLTELRRKASL